MAEKVKRVLPWFNITSQAKLINIEDKHATPRLKTMPNRQAEQRNYWKLPTLTMDKGLVKFHGDKRYG